jgi:hypothetical protein
MPRRKDTTTFEEEEALKQKRIAERKAKKEQELKPVPAFSPEEVTVVFVLGKYQLDCFIFKIKEDMLIFLFYFCI